jgi:hypothetical protein
MAVSFDTGEIVRRSQGVINQAVDRGTGMLADRVEHYTNVAREIGDILRDRGEPQAAEFVQAISERGLGVARYLRNTDPAGMWNDVQDAARGKTWLLAGVGLLGGLALARTVRTAAGDYETRGGSWEDTPAYRESYAQPNTGYQTGTSYQTGTGYQPGTGYQT